MSTISGRYDLVDGTPARRDGSPKASWSAWPLPSRSRPHVSALRSAFDAFDAFAAWLDSLADHRPGEAA